MYGDMVDTITCGWFINCHMAWWCLLCERLGNEHCCSFCWVVWRGCQFLGLTLVKLLGSILVCSTILILSFVMCVSGAHTGRSHLLFLFYLKTMMLAYLLPGENTSTQVKKMFSQKHTAYFYLLFYKWITCNSIPVCSATEITRHTVQWQMAVKGDTDTWRVANRDRESWKVAFLWQ